jgi:ABC-2 type transport system permease protein
MNWRGTVTLYRKEVQRFLSVIMQTVFAPVITSLLYLVIFAYVLEGRGNAPAFEGVSYSQFLVPGLIMMAMIQNAFANSSSSLIFSKITGNVVFILLAPLSSLEFFTAFVAAAVTRAMIVGICVFVTAELYVGIPVAHPVLLLIFALLGSTALGALGLVVGVWADKFDQVATFQNFVILPMSFLSGVFYSIHALPPLWRTLSGANPFFYMIDGFRYCFYGTSDVSPWLSLLLMSGALVALCILCLRLLASGYKLRN